MEALLAGLEATAVAQTLRTSRWLYAATNTAHILGIALLVGAVVPLNLRLLGWWPDVPRAQLIRVLVVKRLATLTPDRRPNLTPEAGCPGSA